MTLQARPVLTLLGARPQQSTRSPPRSTQPSAASNHPRPGHPPRCARCRSRALAALLKHSAAALAAPYPVPAHPAPLPTALWQAPTELCSCRSPTCSQQQQVTARSGSILERVDRARRPSTSTASVRQQHRRWRQRHVRSRCFLSSPYVYCI